MPKKTTGYIVISVTLSNLAESDSELENYALIMMMMIFPANLRIVMP